ncbi:RNA-directed DNA polymerase, eukaryota [Tanacetum coccineum]
MPSTRASISKASKRPKINIIPPKLLFVDLTYDDTKTPSSKHQLSSPNAPNAPSKTPSTKGTSSSSIDYIPKSPTSSTSPSTNDYLNSLTSPPPRVPPPPPTQEHTSIDITLTLSPITPLDVQFNTPSPSPPIFGHPIPKNLLEAHGDSASKWFFRVVKVIGARSKVLGWTPEFSERRRKRILSWRITMLENYDLEEITWHDERDRGGVISLVLGGSWAFGILIFSEELALRDRTILSCLRCVVEVRDCLMIVVVICASRAKEKRIYGINLAHVSNQWVGKLVMMGDFNEVRYKSDRYGSNFNAHDAEIFNSFIYNAGLDEVPLGGSAYTWCLKSASKMSKLDRFFVSENLLSMCPNITAITLERFISDHRPILLREVRYDYGPIPFRFYRYWLEVDGFDKLVRDSWNVAPVNKKNAIRNFMGKLKFLKDRIRSWLSIHRSNSRGEIYFLKEELRSCDEVIDKGDCSNEVAIEGDENVKFFHGMLNKKRNQSNIRGSIKPSVNRACIDYPFPVPYRLSERGYARMISKEEVKRAVWDCGVDKSLGPDGFSFSFYRHFWPVIEKDVFEVVEYFFMYGEIPNGCNSNFIALIPKILDDNMVKDFRPISLIGSLYKIIAKILANRLVGVLGDLVNEVQSAFVADRQILDGPFILDEVLQWCRRKKKHALIFKVDFEKAFDSVRWDFVIDVVSVK